MAEKVFINPLIASKYSKVGKILFIAIDGHVASGKSTLAIWLSSKLNAEIIQTDSFASWDNPFDWVPLAVKYVFDPIKQGSKTLSYPRSKWWENHYPTPMIDQLVTPIMILEGVGALREELRKYISFGIFVDIPRTLCFDRGIKKDMKAGKTFEEVFRLWDQWLDKEDIYLKEHKPQEYADIVVDGTKPFEEQIEF